MPKKVKDREPRVKLNGRTPVAIYSTLSKFLMSVDDAFPEFKDEINGMIAEPAMIELEIMSYNKEKVYLPNAEGSDDYIYLIESPDVKKKMQDFHRKYDDMLDRMEKKYTQEEYPVQYRMLQSIKKHSKLMADPGFMDNLSGMPEYSLAMGRSFLDMPSPLFSNSPNSKNFKVDTDRYKKFMDKHVFIDQMEEMQDFFIDKYIPYSDKKRDGLLTAQDNIQYNKDYFEHLMRQKSYFELIKTYSYSDLDIACNKTLREDAQFNMDWRGQRYGGAMLDMANEGLRLMGNGWPAADIPFIRQIEGMYTKLGDMIENSNKGYTDAEIEAAKQIKSEMEAAYNAITTKELKTPEQRKELLDQLENPVKNYAKVITDYRNRTNFSKSEKAGEHSILWHYEETRSRQVFPEEISRNTEAYNEYVNTQEYPEFQNRLANTKVQREELFRDKDGNMIEDVTKLSRQDLEKAAELYETIFGPIFDKDAPKEYRSEHDGMTTVDFFKVGTRSLREYLGERFTDLAAEDEYLMAEIVRLATDPRVPFSYQTARKNNVTNEYYLTEEFDVLDASDLEKVMVEKPYMKSMSTFEHWYKKTNPSIDPKGIDTDDWKTLYQTQIRVTADRGFLKQEDITDIETLKSQTNQNIPYEMSLQHVMNIYGAKPKFVRDYVGNDMGENTVYTSEQFRNNLAPVEAGGFSDKEFALLAFVASTDPDFMTEDVYPEVGNELSQDEKILLKHDEWTTALKEGKIDSDKYMSKVIGPSRNKLSEMIKSYEAGEDDRLAGTITSGLKNIVNNVINANDLMDPNGKFAFNAHILKDVMDILKKEENSALYSEFQDTFSLQEQKMIENFTRLVDLQDKKLEALGAIKKAQESGEKLDTKTMDEMISDIATFDHFAKMWEENHRQKNAAAELDDEYKRLRKNMLQEASKGASNLGKTEAARAEMELFVRSKITPSKEMMDELSKDEVIYDKSFYMGAQARSIRETINGHLKKYYQLRKARLDSIHNKSDDRPIEETYAVQHDYYTEEYLITKYTRLISDRMSEASKKEVYDRYNELARKKGWKEKKYDEDLGGKVSVIGSDEELEAFFNIILDQIERSPLTLEAIGSLSEEIENLQTPEELDIEDNIEYTYTEELDKLQKKTVKESDKKLLDSVKRNLAERTSSAASFISDIYDPDGITGIVGRRAEANKKKFEGGKFEPEGGLQEYVAVGGEPDLGYKKIKDPTAVNELKKTPLKMAAEPKEKVIAIIKKMKDNQLINKNASTEQTGKIYGHEKILKCKQELMQAVEAGDIEKIRIANAGYENEVEKMKEVFEMTKDAFSDKTLAPGNVDTIRNSVVPPEFSLDIVTDSRVNGLYQTANFAEKLGVTMEQFIENPATHVINYVQKGLKEKGFDSVNKIKGKSGFMASLRALYNKGAELNELGSVEKDIDFVGPIISVGRAIDGFCMYDEPLDKVIDNLSYGTILGEVVDGMISRENAYELAVYKMIHSRKVKPETVREFKDGLKAAFLDGGNIEKKHLPMELYDENGKVLPKPTYHNSLSEKDRYKDIIENFNKSVSEIKEIDKLYDSGTEEKLVDTEFAGDIVEEAMFDYLMAHPEDSKKPEYKALEKAALSAHKKLGLSGDSEFAEKYKTWKKEYNYEVNKLYSSAKERDITLNKQLVRLQTQMQKQAMMDGTEATLNFIKTSDAYKKLIDDRLNELADEYRLGKISENYFINRVENLNHVRQGFKEKPQDPPKFFSESDELMMERDTKLINDRLKNKASRSELDSLENFKEWKIKQMGTDLLQEDELSRAEWDMLYKAAKDDIHLSERPLPGNYAQIDGRVINTLDGNKDIIEEFIAVEHSEAVNQKTLSERKEILREALTFEKGSPLGVIKNKKINKDTRDAAERNLLRKIADAIGAEVGERYGGKFPNGITEETFCRRLYNNPSFKKIVTPVLNALYSEIKPTATLENAIIVREAIIEMIDNKAILNACNMDQKYEQEKQMHKDDPSYNQVGASPGIRHIKSELDRAKITAKKNMEKQMNEEAKNKDASKKSVLGM